MKMQKDLKLEILEKLSTLIAAGFGFVAALAWNDAIQAGFVYVFGRSSTVGAKFGYAIIVTIIVVIITVKVGSLVSTLKRELQKEKGKEQ